MNKIKSFFVGCMLLIIGFAMIILVALVYRANEQMSIKSYIFQMNNSANQRVGELQDLNDISANDLRNKLIKKYVSEYFKVIPGDTDVMKRPIIERLSSSNVFNKWKETEAQTITELSDEKIFRIVRVQDDGIATITQQQSESDEQNAYYAVRYHMYTWSEPNKMGLKPKYEQGTIYMEIRFEPGIRETIHGKKLNLKEYLEAGRKPVGLFMFKVINIGNKENI